MEPTKGDGSSTAYVITFAIPHNINVLYYSPVAKDFVTVLCAVKSTHASPNRILSTSGVSAPNSQPDEAYHSKGLTWAVVIASGMLRAWPDQIRRALGSKTSYRKGRQTYCEETQK